MENQSVRKSILDVQSSVRFEVEARFPNWGQDHKKAYVSQHTLERIDADQITIGLVIQTLEHQVKGWYELACKNTDEQKEYVDNMKLYQSILDSARGFDPKDKVVVVNFYKQVTSYYEDRAEKGESYPAKTIKSLNIFQDVLLSSPEEHLHCAENYTAIAKLFENRMTFSVAPKK